MGISKLAALSLFVSLTSAGLANQIVLTPLDDGQADRLKYGDPYALTNPPSNTYLFAEHNLSTTGQWHEMFLEYSLASLPANATITSASITYGVALMTSSSNGGNTSYPSLSVNLFNGGDGVVTLADLSKNLFNVAQTQDLTDTTTFTTNFFDVSALNNRATNFSSGFLGLELAPRVEAMQTGLWTVEAAQQFSQQAPVITLVFTVPAPEPASLGLVAGGSLLLLRRRAKRL